MHEINDLLRSLLNSTRELTRAITRLLREGADSVDVTVIQLLVLKKLSNNPNINLGELAERLQLTKGTMSGVVDRLVTTGLIQREQSPHDRRVISLKLSTNGQDKLDQAFGPNSLLMKQLSKLLELPEEDIHSLLRIHQQILLKIQTRRSKRDE